MARWIVTVADAQLGEVASVAKALRSRGMAVEQTLDDLGLITGTATNDVADECRQLPGVASIVVEGHMRTA